MQILVVGVIGVISVVLLKSNGKKSRRSNRSEPVTYKEGEFADAFLKRTVRSRAVDKGGGQGRWTGVASPSGVWC